MPQIFYQYFSPCLPFSQSPFLPVSSSPFLRTGAGGVEPPHQDPKSCVLPLDDAPIKIVLRCTASTPVSFNVERLPYFYPYYDAENRYWHLSRITDLRCLLNCTNFKILCSDPCQISNCFVSRAFITQCIETRTTA